VDNNRYLELKRTDESVKHVCDTDARLAQLIDAIGDLKLPLRGELFSSILRSIVGQQLSVHAARAVWDRTVLACNGDVSPESILNLTEQDLRTAGMSRPKISYVRDLSNRVISREIDLSSTANSDDEEIIRVLTKVKGIGRWTVEMLLIFTLGRPDVFAVDDLGLVRAVQWLYELPSPPKRLDMLAYGERWKPHRTVASLYLWEAINRGMVARKQLADTERSS